MLKNKVLMLPDWRGENPYQELLAHNLRNVGVDVIFINYPKSVFPLYNASKLNKNVSAIHLHWISPYIENILWSKKGHIKAIKFLLIATDLLLVRTRGVKLIWTIHNLYSHESRNVNLERILRNLLSKIVNSLIFHSKRNQMEFEDKISKVSPKKINIIPHGNYIDSYPVNLTASKKNYGNALGINILFIGHIRKYKGLDTLLDSLPNISNKKINFLIAGKVTDTDLSERIIQAAVNDKRIIYKPGFVKDEDLASYFSWSDAVLIPFEKTLTSGSAILALSMGKVLIIPESAEVIGLPSEASVIYYRNNQLSHCFDNLPSKDKLLENGIKNLGIAKNLDWFDIAKSTAKLY